MILSGAAKRYAVALFNASVKQDITEQVNDDLVSFTRLLEKNTDFHSFLLSPQILTEHKRQLIVDALGERSAGLFVRFLLLLIDKNRMQFVVEIAHAYAQLFEQLQGILEAKVITAVPLDSDLEQETIEKLELETGKTIRLSKTVDADIIGGMIVIIDDNIIDGSIRHKLEQMKKALAETKVH